jgi:hypothetical protein
MMITQSVKNILSAAAILLLCSSLKSEAQDFARGRITDTVVCRKNSRQKYALYLPSQYNLPAKFPVIAIFDPSGRGTVAIKGFRIAAEKYGYILVCSYNSKNGPLNDNFEAAGAVFEDIFSRFSIDNKRVYTAGFSGGSRFALALASTNDFITGVIGCGAGLPNDPRLYPTGRSVFAYFGTAGFRDMNYLDMFDLMEFFRTKTQVTSYLRTFEGGHEWPSPDILQEAIEWMNLQAMKKNEIKTDTAFVSYLYNKTTLSVEKLSSMGNVFDAERYTRYAVRDFSGLKKVNSFSESLSKTDQSKIFRDASREWQNITSKEREMEERFISSIKGTILSGSVPDTLITWWRNEVISLKSIRDKAKPESSQMASRLLNFVSIFCYEQGSSYYKQNYFDISSFFFEVCTLSDSENMNTYLSFAKSLAGQKKKREALNQLERAVSHGLTDRRSIENEPVFTNLRNEEKYRTIVGRLK